MNGPFSLSRLLRSSVFALVVASVPGVFAKIDYMPPADAKIVDGLLPGAQLLEGGVRFIVRTEGKGPLIKKGDTVTALYVGKLLDGTIFNQKRSRFHSFRFEVGADPRQVIRGWEQVLPLMRNGGTYTVAIPSELAYRERGRAGQVPPHATLIFDIEIIGHEPLAAAAE